MTQPIMDTAWFNAVQAELLALLLKKGIAPRKPAP